MAYSSNFLISAFLVFSYASFVVMSRELKPKSTLMERLRLDEEGTSTCWESLFELQSCTGEVVLFFLNGETYLGPSCCNAIRTIERHCWPSMLGSVGINSEESNILLGYCDATENSGSNTPQPPPSSPQAATPINNTTFDAMNP